MRIFVFEFVTGGGWLAERSNPPTAGLLCEGNAMWRALVEDLVAAGYDVVSTRDARLASADISHFAATSVRDRDDLWSQFRRLAASAAWTIVIAPEIAGWLVRYVGLAIDAGARVLASPLDTIKLAADKHAMAEHLRSAGVPAPRGIALEIGTRIQRDFPFPAVLKPRDGAGSQGIRWVATQKEYSHAEVGSRLEEFVPGIAASVTFLCGPREARSLPSSLQVLSKGSSRSHAGLPGAFVYLGGECPLMPELIDRAQTIAQRAIDTLDHPRGYLGVDLVLGYDVGGSGDRVIEINPRLTTSYIGLRALSQVNLADAMIRIADGEQVDFAFEPGPIQFLSDGTIIVPKPLSA